MEDCLSHGRSVPPDESSNAKLLKFKIMMLGDAGVGKTSIARRFVDDAFANNYIHTIGIDFLEKIIECQGQEIKLQIWDTAGQDRFRTIIRPYYRGAAGIVLAYDVTDEKTFRNIEDWTKNIAENTQSCQIIPKVLIANKTDLPYKSHHVQSDEGRQLAEEHGMKFLEGSAKDGTGIAEAFQELAQLIWHAQQVRRASGHDHSGDDIIHLQEIPVYDKRKRKCCGGVEGIFS